MTHQGVAREADALQLLKRDHDSLRRLFRDFERLLAGPCDVDRKAELVGRICSEMSVHADIEDELFYPAVQAVAGRDTLLDLDSYDHGVARCLIARLDEMEPDDAGYDETVVSLGVCTVAHMRDEEERMFARVRQAGLDTTLLGGLMLRRQRALRADVTRVGLPDSRRAAAVWPQACRYGGGSSSATPARRSERS